MQIGIVGKANVGKSTFFKALTLAEVEIANYPFATIKPNSGIGYVKIKDAAREFGKQANPREGFILGEHRFVPVQVIDVAGLVPGAHEGKGMGLEFLNDLNQADALIHVIDCSGSTNEKGEPINPGGYDPAEDILFLETELDMWYLKILEKPWGRFSRQVTQERSQIVVALTKQFSGLHATEDIIKDSLKEAGLEEKHLKMWTEQDLLAFARLLRKKTKPMIIAANKIDIPIAWENLERLKKRFPEMMIMPCSAESELALREAAKHGLITYIPGEKEFSLVDEGKLTIQQKNALGFIKQNILDKNDGTGVQQIIDAAVFSLLRYVAIHPGGVSKLEDSEGRVLPDCFLMKPGTSALDFAFRLHTDFGENFIKAIDVRTKLPTGKDHVLKNLDIIEIMAKH
ncbi:redox-regulated ATPase YchF [Candidatus Woesearchaeota archaeon]|nr:MAG: hypothetical protein QS99_C0010G0030 [archaeon GW2011_AR4]MBS3130262.1 redox-regulated ATPase YchF [Candidatus Woesearchaeota archaeon]HIH38193.1 redox-regulated ATPase YchF [Candidatus Woesearchaeota archaeon]HIH49488.1 redox-regulated ATPase YchF [Candidatus Woesearchaeota archaeon]HIJ03870.1 redox-regulated ATPase YchF [Candidatus Woesearchaeota archaeon]